MSTQTARLPSLSSSTTGEEDKERAEVKVVVFRQRLDIMPLMTDNLSEENE